MLWKMIPLMAMLGMGSMTMPSMSKQLKKVTGFTKIYATQSEISAMVQIVYLEWVSTEKLPAPESIPQLIRDNMTVQGNRDITKDLWGVSYLYKAESDAGAETAFTFLSGGPDMAYQTDDDISMKRSLIPTGPDMTPQIPEE